LTAGSYYYNKIEYTYLKLKKNKLYASFPDSRKNAENYDKKITPHNSEIAYGKIIIH
jgi:hypothetical protein